MRTGIGRRRDAPRGLGAFAAPGQQDDGDQQQRQSGRHRDAPAQVDQRAHEQPEAVRHHLAQQQQVQRRADRDPDRQRGAGGQRGRQRVQHRAHQRRQGERRRGGPPGRVPAHSEHAAGHDPEQGQRDDLLAHLDGGHGRDAVGRGEPDRWEEDRDLHHARRREQPRAPERLVHRPGHGRERRQSRPDRNPRHRRGGRAPLLAVEGQHQGKRERRQAEGDRPGHHRAEPDRLQVAAPQVVVDLVQLRAAQARVEGEQHVVGHAEAGQDHQLRQPEREVVDAQRGGAQLRPDDDVVEVLRPLAEHSDRDDAEAEAHHRRQLAAARSRNEGGRGRPATARSTAPASRRPGRSRGSWRPAPPPPARC